MSGGEPRRRSSRVLPRAASVTPQSRRHMPSDGPRRVKNTIINFRTLKLPHDVRLALADAFWNHVGARTPKAICRAWRWVKVFARFAVETNAIRGVADLNGLLLVRYVQWLGHQRSAVGEPWGKVSRSSAYTVLRKLLQWIERCRPGLVEPIDYPFNPFPWRNRDSRHRRRLTPQQLRAILRACEDDIRRLRGVRHTLATEPSRGSTDMARPSWPGGKIRAISVIAGAGHAFTGQSSLWCHGFSVNGRSGCSFH
jgi:hypothetical protein